MLGSFADAPAPRDEPMQCPVRVSPRVRMVSFLSFTGRHTSDTFLPLAI